LKTWKFSLISLFFLLASIIFSTAASAQSPQPASLEDVQALESFIDGIMAVQLDAHNTAGSVVAVVKDGERIFSKGYGYANWDNSRPSGSSADPLPTWFCQQAVHLDRDYEDG
jgi:CubicO group peptidase (beta-lactamase class C family)